MFNTVITLICNPGAPLLDDAFAGRFMCELDMLDCGSSRRVVLAPGVAEDFYVDVDPAGLVASLRDFIGGAAIDIAVQQADKRAKRLLIADMDSTIIAQECIDELADFAGKRDEISAITERAMRGELDFEGALTERVAMLQGLPETVLREAFEQRITLTPGAKTLVQTMNARTAVTALVSGGFTFFVDRVGAACGFDATQANDLMIENGALTGAVGKPILGREAKRQALIRIAAEHDIDLADTLAVGDGANDLDMLGAAGLGVAFHAKPAVAAAADVQINHGDLTALLYLQGVPKAEFVEND